MIEEEKEIDVEQLDDVLGQGEEISQKDILDQEEHTGSTFGKFKSGKALLEAYNNLQREFTKKCQTLAKMQNIDNDNTPIYLQKNWSNLINKFVEENPEAEDFVLEIEDALKNDKVLCENENPIFVAWNRVATKKIKSPKKLLSDKEFLENFIFNNESIKNEIVGRYINELNNISSPRVIGRGDGAKVILTSSAKPKTLQEAGVIAKEMMK